MNKNSPLLMPLFSKIAPGGGVVRRGVRKGVLTVRRLWSAIHPSHLNKCPYCPHYVPIQSKWSHVPIVPILSLFFART